MIWGWLSVCTTFLFFAMHAQLVPQAAHRGACLRALGFGVTLLLFLMIRRHSHAAQFNARLRQ